MNTHIIHNVQTGEITEIPFTEAEEKEYLGERKKEADNFAIEKAKAEAKAALLERLSITEEEAKLLLG